MLLCDSDSFMQVALRETQRVAKRAESRFDGSRPTGVFDFNSRSRESAWNSLLFEGIQSGLNSIGKHGNALFKF